jgi:hypothetical protein
MKERKRKMKKIIRNENSKYHYDYINDNNERFELKSKSTDNYFHLPEMIDNRRMISIKDIEENIQNDELILDDFFKNRRKRNYNSNSSYSSKSNYEFINYIDEDEDIKIFNELREKYEKKMKKIKILKEIERLNSLIEE